MKHLHKLVLWLYATFVLAALVIVVDFVMPGNSVHDEIISVQQQREQYYNAARNYHYSYKVITSQHAFSITEDLGELELTGKKIEYSVSPIFKEVNWYRLHTSESKTSYSLRTLSGLVLPLLSIILILIAYRSKKNLGTLVFVLQTLLIADLIYLLF